MLTADAVAAGHLAQDGVDATALLAEAEALLREALALDPSTGGAAADLDESGLTMGRTRVVRDVRTEFTTRLRLAQVHLRQGNRAEARRQVDRCLRLAPHEPETYRYLAELAALDGDPREEVIAHLQGMVLNGAARYFRHAERLRTLYAERGAGTAAVAGPAGAPRLDTRCPRVRADLDEACRRIHQRLVETRSRDQAESFRDLVVRRFGCTPSLFAPTP